MGTPLHHPRPWLTDTIVCTFSLHRIARRDAARARFEQKQEDKISASCERVAAIREKDKATMDMFMQIAKQKYG